MFTDFNANRSKKWTVERESEGPCSLWHSQGTVGYSAVQRRLPKADLELVEVRDSTGVYILKRAEPEQMEK